MHRLYILPLVLLLVLRGPPQARAQGAPAGQAFTSEAIDRGVFKEGEVRRFEGHFLSWRVVCDEVPRIKQRFCSLFTAGADAAGRPVTVLTVSTSDEGRPAAMIRLPHGVSIKRGLEVLTGPPAGNAPPPARRARLKQPLKEKAAVLKLGFPSCDAQGCITLWNLTPKQIAALSSGGTLRIKFTTLRSRYLWMTPPTGWQVAQEEAVIDGAGFGDAIKATAGNSPQ